MCRISCLSNFDCHVGFLNLLCTITFLLHTTMQSKIHTAQVCAGLGVASVDLRCFPHCHGVGFSGLHLDYIPKVDHGIYLHISKIYIYIIIYHILYFIYDILNIRILYILYFIFYMIF